MKKITIKKQTLWSIKYAIFIIACCGVINTSADEASDEPLNLLFMGNSYTFFFDLPAFVSQLAVADGYTAPFIVTDLEGGQDVEYHLSQVTSNPHNNVAHPGIAGLTFDFAVLQGHSQEATSRRDPVNDFIPNTIAWAEAVRGSTAGADTGIVLFQTWARAAIHSFYPGSFADPAAMQMEIRTNYEIANAEINQNNGNQIARVAPVGDAFETTGFNPALYDTDQSHPTVLGSRLAAMVMYRTIYGETVSDIAYSAISSSGISESDWIAAQSWADSVTIEPVVPADADLDGIADVLDNCLYAANPDQRDSNGDGFGNLCDGDLNNDGIVNFLDIGLFAQAFLSSDADADMDGNGVVNLMDYSLLTSSMFTPPGPSGATL